MEEFRGDPNEWRTKTGNDDAAAREAIHQPGKNSRRDTPQRHHHEEQTPTRGWGDVAVDGEDRGDPGFGGDAKNYGVQKSAGEGDTRRGAKQNHHEDSDTDPRVDGQVKSGERQREG